MTSAAQEHLTGMPTPKQDKRTPGPWVARSDDWVFWIGVEGDFADGCDFISIAECHTNSLVSRAAAEANAAFIVQACNAYGSTDALREALHVAEQNFEAIRKVLVNNLVEPERSAFWLAVRARDAARTALAGVTDPQTDIAKR